MCVDSKQESALAFGGDRFYCFGHGIFFFFLFAWIDRFIRAWMSPFRVI